MDKQKAETVRLALEDYLKLYDEPNLRVVSKKMDTNYNNLTSFLNKKKTLGEPSLKKIVKYLQRIPDRNKRLEEIIKRVS